MPAGRHRRRDDPFVRAVVARLVPLGLVRARAMFGGWGVYRDDLMFGLIAGKRLYLKVDGDTRGRFAAAGSRPFVYQSAQRRIEMSYWLAPEGALAASEALLSWAELAVAAASRVRALKRPTRR